MLKTIILGYLYVRFRGGRSNYRLFPDWIGLDWILIKSCQPLWDAYRFQNPATLRCFLDPRKHREDDQDFLPLGHTHLIGLLSGGVPRGGGSLIFPNVPQSSLGILRVPQLPPPLNTPPLGTLQTPLFRIPSILHPQGWDSHQKSPLEEAIR